MNDRVTALIALRDKVQDGEHIFPRDAKPCFEGKIWVEACRAALGSLDAAKALHDAALPDEGWEVYRTAKYPGMIPGSCPSPYKAIIGWGKQVSGHADTPARAWLLAILSALIAESK